MPRLSPITKTVAPEQSANNAAACRPNVAAKSVWRAADVAAAAVFYASAETEFITGTTLLVDGGMTAGYHQREKG